MTTERIDCLMDRECDDCGGKGYRDEWGDPPVPCVTCDGRGWMDDDDAPDQDDVAQGEGKDES